MELSPSLLRDLFDSNRKSGLCGDYRAASVKFSQSIVFSGRSAVLLRRSVKAGGRRGIFETFFNLPLDSVEPLR